MYAMHGGRPVVALILFTVPLLALPLQLAADINPPAITYSTASIVNAASYSADALAPNTIASIYGTNLAYGVAAVSPGDMQGGGLPTQLGGVSVYFDGLPAGLYYVSPLQINLLVPNLLIPGVLQVVVARNGFAGPSVPVTLNLTGPALFADAAGNAIAQHLDGTLVSMSLPAQPGEWVVLYAEGLGRTVPDEDSYLPSAVAAPIVGLAQFSLTINGAAIPGSAIYYAGITPGCAGLYQINVQLPADAPPTPQIRISIGTAVSAGQTQLPIA